MSGAGIASRTLLLGALVALGGCASLAERTAEHRERRAIERIEASVAKAEREERYRRSIPRCDTEASCAAGWEAAQLWIVQNAGMRLATATSVVLETYPSPSASLALAARALKEPAGGGRYRIIVWVGCANIFGCNRDLNTAALDFNRTVRRAIGRAAEADA